jgi:hypothetical protein
MFKAICMADSKARTGMIGYLTMGMTNEVFLAISDGDGEYEEIDPNTIGINSGKNDKNGRHIYSFDVVKVNSGDEFIVKYDIGRCAFVVSTISSDMTFMGYLGLLPSDSLEIVGNLFTGEENAELVDNQN